MGSFGSLDKILRAHRPDYSPTGPDGVSQGNIAAIAKVIEARLLSERLIHKGALHLEDRLKQAASPTGPGGVTQGNIAAIAKVIEAIFVSHFWEKS